MAEFSNVATQTVAVNGNVLFTDAPTSVCNKGYISHRTGSGLINLKGATNTCKAKYRVSLMITRDIFSSHVVTKQCDRVNVCMFLYNLQPFTGPLNCYF